jgi:hypothetical protein
MAIPACVRSMMRLRSSSADPYGQKLKPQQEQYFIALQNGFPPRCRLLSGGDQGYGDPRRNEERGTDGVDTHPGLHHRDRGPEVASAQRMERWVRSVKAECLSKIIPFGERSLRRAMKDYVAHYHTERNHQGKNNVLLFHRRTKTNRDKPVLCRERLGGLLRYYHREAA